MSQEVFSKKSATKLTPMMQQYLAIKEEHQDYLLFYRMGDFYEMFYNDAVIASEILDIVLTKRSEDTPMCGVPAHSHVYYLEKLVKAGYKVAICEQLETPEEAKKRGYKAIVRREVVRIITPGTIIEDSILDPATSNFLCAIIKQMDGICLSLSDITTGKLFLVKSSIGSLEIDLARFNPSEIIISDKVYSEKDVQWYLKNFAQRISTRAHSLFELSRCERMIKEFYKVAHTDGILKLADLEKVALGALLEYLSFTQKQSMPHLRAPLRLETANYMAIDPATMRSLEIKESYSGSRKQSLLGVIDRTITAAGGRLLDFYLSSPLVNPSAINKRLDAVEFFLEQSLMRNKLREVLKEVPDLERALAKIWINKATPKEIASIREGLKKALKLAELILFAGVELTTSISGLTNKIANFSTLLNLLEFAVNEILPIKLEDGGLIRNGYNKELDHYRNLASNVGDELEKLRDKYRLLTAVNTLKISFNNVLGYFIEVTPLHKDKLSDEAFIHRQTLGNSVRFTSIELKKLEEEINSAEHKIKEIELAEFKKICDEIIKNTEEISMTAQSVASIDLFTALADLAQKNNYCRPLVDDSNKFEVVAGRHPVVEYSLKETFHPNDCTLSDSYLWIITGPNMAGKSTFLRQNALLAILAQIGSYVPATSAHIGVVDKVFSRIGASDDITKGHSTFMVEMTETAAILNSATHRSLVIFDEIGRGTATFDGLAIAWSVVEKIHNEIKCRTLFATHYHELTELEGKLSALLNYTVMVKEWEGKIIFMHQVVRGKADKSYGINVAELAGIPQDVIARATEILHELEHSQNISVSSQQKSANDNSAVLTQIKNLDIDTLTPKNAYDILYDIKTKI
ncbi:MAG: DNA mismatch repair protein MutS [Rickettsiales bacterium]